MKHLLFSALLLGLVGCGGNGGSQVSAVFKPTALDSAMNGLYKAQPQVKRPASLTPVREAHRLGVE